MTVLLNQYIDIIPVYSRNQASNVVNNDVITYPLTFLAYDSNGSDWNSNQHG